MLIKNTQYHAKLKRYVSGITANTWQLTIPNSQFPKGYKNDCCRRVGVVHPSVSCAQKKRLRSVWKCPQWK